jgi:hypothetical protein
MPWPRIAVAKDKFARGYPKPRAQIAYERLDLVTALEHVYLTDAHAVCYILPDGHPLVQHNRQPRLTKQAPADVLAETLFTTILVDADNPGHAPWTPELLDAALERYANAPLPFGVYHTTKGARFVLPLAAPVPVADAEPLIRRALAELDAAGLRVDWSAKDWTRHMRMPNVLRGGQPFRSPYVDLSRMRPVDLEPLSMPARARSPRAKREPLPPIPFTPTLAEHWQARAATIGGVVRDTVQPGTWHDLFLALAGAILQRRVPPEYVPELVRLVAIAAASRDPAHHERSARDTVGRYLNGIAVSGMRDLVTRWPSVADAVQDAIDDGARLVAAPAPPPTPAETLAATTDALERTIANAPDGLTVVVAECGLGKTNAAQRVAARRARVRPDARRSPAQTKTSISVDKNELAIQVAEDLAAHGVPVRRVFGPLSVVDDRGEPICKFAHKALPLVEGGQSITWEFCLGRGKHRCEYYDECPAKDGERLHLPPHIASIDTRPRVTVGTHALLGELDASAGTTGLLVIDEPPPLLETMVLTLDDVRLAIANVDSFERVYADAMRPVLLALKDWDDPDVSFADLTDTLDRPPTGPDDKPLPRPPLRHDAARACRADVVVARTVGATSRTLRALYAAMVSTDASVRLEEDPHRIVVTAPRDDLAAALRRQGAVVAMDANADLHLPGFAKVVDYDPPLHRFVAADGARIERTMLRCGSATRRSWFSHGKLVLDTGLLAALRGVVAWVKECADQMQRPVALGIITVRTVEIAIRAALGEDVVADWVRARQSASTFERAIAAIRDILADAPISSVLLAHYGATRGLNRLAGVDCLATVGDPWPNVGIVQTEADYLDVAADARLVAATQAELEQAHGRLRTVHRRAPGFALHVGRVVPGGSGWLPRAVDPVTGTSLDPRPAVRFQSLPGGRPPAGSPMPQGELAELLTRLGGARAAARELGCAPSTVHRYLAGRGVPPAVASRLRSLADSASHAE